MKALIFALIALLTLTVLPLTPASAPAFAQGLACIGLPDLLGRLAKSYGEAAILVGNAPDGSALMITASPSGGTWTAILQRPDGTGCPFASGTSWHPGEALPPQGQEG